MSYPYIKDTTSRLNSIYHVHIDGKTNKNALSYSVIKYYKDKIFPSFCEKNFL